MANGNFPLPTVIIIFIQCSAVCLCGTLQNSIFLMWQILCWKCKTTEPNGRTPHYKFKLSGCRASPSLFSGPKQVLFGAPNMPLSGEESLLFIILHSVKRTPHSVTICQRFVWEKEHRKWIYWIIYNNHNSGSMCVCGFPFPHYDTSSKTTSLSSLKWVPGNFQFYCVLYNKLLGNEWQYNSIDNTIGDVGLGGQRGLSIQDPHVRRAYKDTRMNSCECREGPHRECLCTGSRIWCYTPEYHGSYLRVHYLAELIL